MDRHLVALRSARFAPVGRVAADLVSVWKSLDQPGEWAVVDLLGDASDLVRGRLACGTAMDPLHTTNEVAALLRATDPAYEAKLIRAMLVAHEGKHVLFLNADTDDGLLALAAAGVEVLAELFDDQAVEVAGVRAQFPLWTGVSDQEVAEALREARKTLVQPEGASTRTGVKKRALELAMRFSS